MNKVVIIIVNWNTGDLLRQCLESLAGLKEEQELIEEVIVVDNASHDKSVIKAKQLVGERLNKPRVRFIINDNNVGFAAANNIGFDRARQLSEEPHILLLNPDTVVRPGMISGLVDVLDKNDRIGIVGPKLLNSDGSLQPSVRHFPTERELLLYMLKLGWLVTEEKIDYDRGQAVEQVMGAAFLIRNKTWQKVGDLDDNFFVWFEEVDYCQRAKKENWLIWYTPTGECMHWGGISFKQLVGWRKMRPWLTSLLYYAKKYMGTRVVAELYLLVPVVVLLTGPVTVWHAWQSKERS